MEDDSETTLRKESSTGKLRFLSPVVRKSINCFLGVGDDIVEIKFDVENKVFEIYVPYDQQWFVIKDILLNREYEYLPEFALKNFNGLVVDAGAHVGLFSFVSSLFAREIVALEPHPVNYRLLEINTRKNEVDNVIAINKALWNEKGKVRVYEGLNSSRHSICYPSNKFFEVSTETLQGLIEEFGTIDLLKVDVEGSEFRIFEGIDIGILRNINSIVGEIHPDCGDASSIVRSLVNAGFSVNLFRTPLFLRKNPYSIRLHGCARLKLLVRFLHSLPLPDFGIDDLLILFASRNRSLPCAS